MQPGNVLEVGCAGRDLEGWFKSLGHRYVGIDREARGRGPTFLMDVTEVEEYFEPGLFDIAVAMAVLPHVKDPHMAISNVRSVLRDGGLFVGTWTWVYGSVDNASYWHPSESALRRLLEEQGFEVEVLEPEWPIWKSVPDLLFNRPGGLPWRIAAEATLFGLEASFLVAQSFACWVLGRTEMDLAQRSFDTAGAFAFAARAV